MDYKNYVDRINNLSFKGLENVKCGDALISVIIGQVNYSKVRNLLRSIKRTFQRRVTITANVENGKHKPVLGMLFSNGYSSRTDHRRSFDLIAELIPDRVCFLPCEIVSLTNVKYFPLLLSWYRSFKRVFSSSEAFFYAEELYISFLDAKYIVDSVKESGIKYLFTFCDHHLIDSLVTQLLKKSDVSTVTIQHGYYVKGSFAYDYSHSDYFLCYGQCSIENASGTNATGRFVPVGMPQLIERSVRPNLLKNTLKRFVIIMGSNPELKDDELKVLQITEKLVEKFGYSRIIKMHPGATQASIDWKLMDTDKLVFTEKSVVDLIPEADFAIIPSGSTVYIEYLLELFPSFLYRCNMPCFEESEEMKFSNLNELEMLIDRLDSDPDRIERSMKNIREFHTMTNDVKRNYSVFFADLISNRQ